MRFVISFGYRIRLPDGRPARRFRCHDINAVSFILRQRRNARADKFHDFVFDIAVCVGRSHQAQRHILRANARTKFSGHIYQNNLRTLHVIGALYQLLGKFAAAFANPHGAKGAITGMRITAKDHPAYTAHAFAVIAVNDCHAWRYVNTSVFMSCRQRKLMIIFVNGSADCTECIVTVGQYIRHWKLRHAGCTGGLDNANIGNVMAGQ